HLDTWTQARRAIALQYDQLLAKADVITPTVMPYSHHVYHIYAVRSTERDLLQQRLHEQGVQTGIHYPIPVHLQPAYADLGYQAGDFPQSELAAKEVLSLPMFAELSSVQIETVSAALSERIPCLN
ncbi:MAG: DegT/DnrJ/EryC1/StrS family aminotransferase, partial [Sphaerospermopsis kisseleviana]